MAEISNFIRSLPEYPNKEDFPERDWLLYPGQKGLFPAKIYKIDGDELVISNGLVKRRFILTPNCATIEYKNLIGGDHLIRGIKPEAIIILDGKGYKIGGLSGQPDYAYFLPQWKELLTAEDDSFVLENISANNIKERFKWKRKRYRAYDVWPPKGKEITFIYFHKDLPGIKVEVHYEIYDDIPLISKWLRLINNSEHEIKIDGITSEILAVVESTSVPQGDPKRANFYSPLYMESDYIFGAMSPEVGNVTIRYEKDPQYTTQVAYNNDSPLLLISRPPIGPGLLIGPRGDFEGYRTYELVLDSTERERVGLAKRRMYKIIAPWTTENPIFMHITTADPKYVKEVIDQCAEVGFEMVILSFGCGIQMEWEEDEFYEEFREVFNYAHQKGIEIGAYSLFSSRSIGPDVDVIDPKTGKTNTHAVFGKAPCLATEWGADYLRKLKKFIVETGADFIEHDGPYPGDLCASESHKYHRGLEDSQWVQWRMQSDFYKWCRENGIYVNAPDWYFLSGTNKTGMGYKEVNWSLPRERQVIIARQNIFDGTYNKLPSMGWMFTPLSVYHKVGEWKRSTLEPLSEHLEFYEKHLAQNFLAGVQSCYRGLKLYDSEHTKEVVRKWTGIYRKYRAILDSEIIHIERPSGREFDGYLHVNPDLDIKGFAVFFNPLNEQRTECVRIPLYYTGIKDKAIVAENDTDQNRYQLDCDINLYLDITIPPESWTWFTIRQG